MKRLTFFAVIVLFCINIHAQLTHPIIPKTEASDTLWGTIYKDNYRWLEDLKDPKVISWFKQQANFANSSSDMDELQHVKKGVSYPAMLITTGYNDPRVPSSGTSKFPAVVEADNPSKNPILLSVEVNSGHFGNANFEDYMKQTSREFAFLLWQCGHPDFQMKNGVKRTEEIR